MSAWLKWLIMTVVVVTVIVIILIFFKPADAAPVGYHWGPPTVTNNGFIVTPDYIQYYNIYVVGPDSLIYHSSVTDTSAIVEVPFGQTISIAVAAVDTFNREGSVSEHSDPFFVDPGTMTSPTKPVRFGE